MNDPIRPRTDNERAAYLHGWATAINLVDERGVEAAREELKIMAFFEWPEDWVAPGVPTTKESMTTTFKLNPNALKWVEALESGEYQQTNGRLARVGDEYCCLGVACEVALANGVPLAVSHDDAGKTYNGISAVLPVAVRDWLGLRRDDGAYRDESRKMTRSLAGDNDKEDHDFARIAQTIRTTPSLFREPTVD